MEDRDQLGSEEFVQELLDRVSKKIVSVEYIYENSDFVDGILEDLFISYKEGCPLSSLSYIFESVFFNLFKNKPSLLNLT